ncbi:AraC family transcriptional regulator [Afifella sp. IM 167]|uniref:AraC family transcriptional regulator n=1 Tax=Afifella sp. IM 167 TaxID=2033586 RepID=UPI001CCC513C|nr:AraC family transcriptional regulator [Afifella sp. IM 167]MBZ8133670.1 AraC family transcriptional regulator [Afifella sp. IM 167]
MLAALLTLCRRYADIHADRSGAAITPVPGLTIVRALHAGELQVAVNKPLIAMLLQGRKRVSSGAESHEYGAGEALVISADAPTVSQITEASRAVPYYALVLELDPAILRDSMAGISPRRTQAHPVRIEPLDENVADAALRLVRLLDRPEALTALGNGLLRELHYWLLTGSHGDAIRRIGAVDSHAERIGRAVAVLRRDYARTIRVEQLAAVAGMSEPAFHQHFRQVTTLSPLQFQKQLRLIEARRMMLAEGSRIAQAAHAVGYQSISHFTREYGRFFGAPPRRDIQQAREPA